MINRIHPGANPRRHRIATALMVLALVGGALVVSAPQTSVAAAQSAGHSDWAPFVGEFQMWCTNRTGGSGPCASHHDGWAIDIDVPFNGQIHASGPGTVAQVFDGCRKRGGDGYCNSRAGNWISIDHGDHWSRYIHMASIADGIEVGSPISAGQIVGYSGASGTQDGGVHLHYDETAPQNLPVERIFFGPMLACHGNTVVQYPDALGTTDWQSVPWGSVLRNDGYECLGGVTPSPLPPPGGPSSTDPDPIVPAPGGSVGLAFGDFNGNGRQGLAIGVPGDTVRGKKNAGSAVVVTQRPRKTTTQMLRQGQALKGRLEGGDLAGAALAAGDFDCNGFDDLAVGAPAEKVGRARDSGLVSVTHGSRRDVDNRAITLTQGRGFGDTAEGNDLTGAALAAGDFNGDGCDDLAAGAPGEDLGAIADAGSVLVTYGSRSGLGNSATAPAMLAQGSTIVGDPEPGDLVGAALATGNFNCDAYDDLAIGAPGEGIDAAEDAGAVVVVYGSGTGLDKSVVLYQSGGLAGLLEANDHVGAALAAGDFNGDGCDDLAAGAPGEDLEGGAVGTGAVSIVYGSDRGLTESIVIYQGTGGLRGKPQAGDATGSALAAGDFDCDGDDDLAVGAPGEQVRRSALAGWVGVVEGAPSGLRGAMAWRTTKRSLPGTAEAGDAVGSSLAAGDADGDGCDDLAIGAPGEDLGPRVDAGEVTLVYGSERGLSSPRTYSQRANLPGASSDGDMLGSPSVAHLLSTLR